MRFLDQEMLSSMLTIRGVSEPLGTLLDAGSRRRGRTAGLLDNGLTNLSVRFLDQEMLSSMLTIRGVSEPLGTLLDAGSRR
ncbi:hypothetical protein CKQ90_34075, partial [Klebsiella pneumoniae]